MVGVKVRTTTRSGPSNTVGAPSARAFIAGVTERGRSNAPVATRSIVDFEKEFGTNQTYSAAMYRTAQTFFEEGGSELVVCRAVGTAAAVALLTLNDRTATPLPTMRIDAANAGAWAAGITVQITAGAIPATTVTLQAWLNGERVVYVKDKSSVAEIVAALSTDVYLRGTDLAPVSVYPTRLPALVGPSPLVGGSDDRASVTIARVVSALNLAGITWGAGAVATPGYNATVAGVLLLAHCKLNRRVAILAGDVGSTTTDLIAMAALVVVDGEYAGVFGPWLTQPDGSSVVQVSPEGYVLGVRARAMNVDGFWQAPAGGRSEAKFVLGPVVTYDGAVIDVLADAHVSAITSIGRKTVLYGWRSCSIVTDQWALLNARDATNTLTGLVESALQPYVFETIDGTGQLVGRIEGALVGVCQPIEDAGGITAKRAADGTVVNPAYRVDVTVLNETTISCTVAVRMSGTSESIEVNIIKAAFNASV